MQLFSTRLPTYTMLPIILLLSACKDDGPTAADITAAYELRQAEEREYLLSRHGTPEEVPGAQWGLASVRHEVDLTDCEKAANDRGYLCVYDLRLFAMGGDEEMPRFSPVRDVEARVFKVAEGWDFEELRDDDASN